MNPHPTIDKKKVMIVPFPKMMSDFENLMDEILEFLEHNPSDKLLEDIKNTALRQKEFKSKHKYDLEKFGLTEEKIKKDCEKIYKTFLT